MKRQKNRAAIEPPEIQGEKTRKHGRQEGESLGYMGYAHETQLKVVQHIRDFGRGTDDLVGEGRGSVAKVGV